MEATTSSINERLGALANSDLSEFRQFFRRLRKLFPEQAAEACLWYIASKGVDVAARSMAFWLAGDHLYISVLLDPESLPPEIAAKAVTAVKEMDPDFLLKFAKAVAEIESPPVVLRALSLLPAIGDYGLLIPWLRSLSHCTDLRVRSRSAKLLCELRPNKSMIERQMHSNDPRIRASAIEVLWHSNSGDARPLFQSALTDPHHRVVGNAMVGLYLLGDSQVLNDMIGLCGHKDHLFRAAMAWAMGFIKDMRAIPAVQELTRDKSLMVRTRALKTLLILESLKAAEPAPAVEIAGAEPGPQQPEAPAQEAPETVPPEDEPAATEEPSFNLFMFK